MSPFYFVDINRTASSSIRAALDDDTEMHLSARQARARTADWEERFTFSVVRNPFSKVVSQYKHRKSFHHLSWTAEDFERWVTVRYEHEDRDTGPNEPYRARLWWPQSRWLCVDGEVMVQRVFFFEELGAAWEEIQWRLGIDRELPHRNPAADKTPWSDFYTPRAERIIRGYFQEDFRRFGYAP